MLDHTLKIPSVAAPTVIGCAATCDAHSWCWSNDVCYVWDVAYEGLWETCPEAMNICSG